MLNNYPITNKQNKTQNHWLNRKIDVYINWRKVVEEPQLEKFNQR